jgi:hypothetical protein
MKKLFSISIVLILFFGIINSYAGNSENYGYDNLINTFEKSNSKFKYYNMKASINIDKNLNLQEMKDIAMKLNQELGFSEDSVKWGQITEDGLNQVYAQSAKDNMNMSVIIENNSKENKGESYIIVDINENKVYKNIVGNYAKLQKSLEKYSDKVDIYTCLIGEYDRKISLNISNNIVTNILNNLNAKEIERIEDDNFMSITAYSKKLNGTNIQYLGKKVNLNIGMRYSEYDQKTLIYVATPLIRLDY